MKTILQQHTRALAAATMVGLFAFSSLQAETLTFKPVENNRTKVSLEGTSNVQDWDAESDTIRGAIELKSNGFWGDSGIIPAHLPLDVPLRGEADLKATVQIESASLTSNSRRLTSNLHDYMEANRHPYIRFALTSLELSGENNTDPEDETDSFITLTKGSLTVSGDSREIAFPVKWTREEDLLLLEGTVELKMSDFGIDPPRLMFGALRAADEVTIKFLWILEPENR